MLLVCPVFIFFFLHLFVVCGFCGTLCNFSISGIFPLLGLLAIHKTGADSQNNISKENVNLWWYLGLDDLLSYENISLLDLISHPWYYIGLHAGDLVGRRHFHPIQPVFLQATHNLFCSAQQHIVLCICHWKCRQCQTKWGFPFCRFCVVAKHLPTVHATLNPFIYWSQLLTSQIILFRRIFNSTLNTCCITSSVYHFQLWVQFLRKQWQLHIVTLSSDENLFSTCPDQS